MKVKKVVCIQCHNACRLAATVDGPRLVSAESDREFPGAKSSNHHSGRFQILFPECGV